MKTIFFLLAVANLALWSAWEGWLGGDLQRYVTPAQTEPQRLLQQIQPARVTVAPLPALNIATQNGGSGECLEIGALSTPTLNDTLTKLAGLGKISPRSVPATPGYLVYLPARETHEQSERLAQDLRDKGEQQAVVIREASPQRYAISMGLYNTADAATARVASLAARGVTEARIVQRTERSPRHFVQISEIAGSQRPTLQAMAKEIGLEWHACLAPANPRSANSN